MTEYPPQEVSRIREVRDRRRREFREALISLGNMLSGQDDGVVTAVPSVQSGRYLKAEDRQPMRNTNTIKPSLAVGIVGGTFALGLVAAKYWSSRRERPASAVASGDDPSIFRTISAAITSRLVEHLSLYAAQHADSIASDLSARVQSEWSLFKRNAVKANSVNGNTVNGNTGNRNTANRNTANRNAVKRNAENGIIGNGKSIRSTLNRPHDSLLHSGDIP